MNVAVFTSNQPRHLSLVRRLASISSHVHAVLECTTLFPGEVEDFYKKSPIMREYFGRVLAAERQVFGDASFTPENVRCLSMRMGDISSVPWSVLKEIDRAEALIVCGSSYIRGPLCEYLVSRGAVNIHMGVSPHYRGNSCNFWAAYDGRIDLIGATVHRLSKGLDSGPILFHALPAARHGDDYFQLGMRSVQAAHEGVASLLDGSTSRVVYEVPQDRSAQIRYSRSSEFTDAVAEEFLERLPSEAEIHRALTERDLDHFVRPFIF
jgi:hypothetical protein